MFNNHLPKMEVPENALISRGLSRYRGSGSRDKEPDRSYKPRATRPSLNDKPTFVIECGISESMNNLRSDAHFWLTKSNGQIKLVVLIFTDVLGEIVKIERWENRAKPRQTRSSSALSTSRPTCIQKLNINNNTSHVSGAPLVLPANLIFDTMPLNLGLGEFSISRARLLQNVQESFQVI